VACPADWRAKVSRLWLRVRDALLRSLDPAEREAVFGDFVELAMTDRQVVKSLLGLVMRRQLRLWREWNPWFGLVAIILPVCPSLASQSNPLSEEIWPGLVLWLHHGPTSYTGLTPAAGWAGFCFQAIALSTWSWTGGFALGTMSRRTIWVSGGLFFGLYVAFAISTAPLFYRILWLTWWAWLPLLMSFLFVFLPAGCGLWQSTNTRNIKLPRMVLLTLWTMTMGGLALWTRAWDQAAMDNWSRGGPALTLSQLAQRADPWKAGITHLITTAVLTAPIVYVLAKVYVQHAPDRAVIRQG
jgi:hypothetical protein